MSVLSDLDVPELICDVLEQRREEVDILDEDVGVLHAHDAGALELAIFEVKVKLSAALVHTLVGPVVGLATDFAERKRDRRTLAQRLAAQALDRVANLLVDARTVVTLLAASFGQLPLLRLLWCVTPAHVLLRVVLERTQREEFRINSRSSHRHILYDANKVAHDKLL